MLLLACVLASASGWLLGQAYLRTAAVVTVAWWVTWYLAGIPWDLVLALLVLLVGDGN